MTKERLQYSETPPYWRQELERSRRRLMEFEEKGVGALSQYDVQIAFSGNEELALRTSSQLVRNHIGYYEEKLRDTPEQITLFDIHDPTL